MIYYFSGTIDITPTVLAASNHCYFGASLLKADFETNTSITFGQIILDDSYTKFNTTTFIITAPSQTNITIMYLNEDTGNSTANELMLDFYANTSSGLVTFTIGGFEETKNHLIYKNNVLTNSSVCNTTGYITWKNSVWAGVPVRFKVYVNGTSQTRTIRTYGIDYFVWLGQNTTASMVDNNITGFNEAAEYLAILDGTGSWLKWYGDGTGTNWNIHTYDVVRSYMNDAVGNITFNITINPDIDYVGGRTVLLKKVGNGYNYTGYTTAIQHRHTLSSICGTELNLTSGYFIGRWNRTTFTYNFYVSGFGITDHIVYRYDVIMSKIDVDKTWVMPD